MDSSDLSTLIGRLEREADTHPHLYLGKVAIAACTCATSCENAGS